MKRTPLRQICLVLILAVVAAYRTQGNEHGAADAIAGIGALLAGAYDNSAQVTQGEATPGDHAPQHVTVTIEPTPRAEWQVWRVHMEVDPAVAKSAGSATALDAIWAMNILRPDHGTSFQLIPYTLRPSDDEAAVHGSTFDETQWLSLEACELRGDAGASHIVAQVTANEMCVAEAMGLGGKRAFLPSRIEREGDWLRVQISYFGEPWRVDARRAVR